MQTTTNYGFSIAEGSDSVNLLTQLYPNFTSLDGILLPIQNNGTTPATHTKAGTVHQLVRTTTGCSVLRFVATGNYAAGDTFTVDGASVTATSCNGQSLPAGAFVINQSVMAILNGAVLTVLAGGSSISDASDVIYNNAVSGLTATNVQNAIDEVYSDIPTGFPATAITYDNTTSGLTATDVQNAINEIAQGGGGGGSEHGLYELWNNSSPTTAFAGQTITITNDIIPNCDAFIIVGMNDTAETGCAHWYELDKEFITSFVTKELQDFRYTGGSFQTVSRNITSVSLAGNTLSMEFAGGIIKPSTANNSVMIPMRIMGLIHNS